MDNLLEYHPARCAPGHTTGHLVTNKANSSLAVLLGLALALGGRADVGSALWLANAAFLGATQIAVPAAVAGHDAIGRPSTSPACVGPACTPDEYRTGSTRGSWTGVCDPVCPTKEAAHE